MKKEKNHISAFEKKRIRDGLILTIPGFILVIIFIIWPLIDVFIYSFHKWNGVSANMKFVGLENYKTLTELTGFWEMAGGTCVYAAGVMVFTIVISFIIALALDKKGRFRLNRGFLRSLWFFPCLLSMTVVGILWRIMYNYNNGVINSILKSIGGTPVVWLETYGVTRWAIIIASVWSLLGICIIVFLAGLQSIPGELYEAAAIDGASGLNQLKNVTIPLMAPSITINILTTTITAFKEYELPLFVSHGLPGHHTTLLTQKIYDLGFKSNDFGKGSALSVVLIIIITLISLLQLLYLRKREDIY